MSPVDSAALASLLPQLRPFATADGFDEQIALCAGVAIGRKAPAEAERAAAAAGVAMEAQKALVSLFLEAARTGVASSDLAASLESVLPAQRANAVAALATEGLPTLRGTIESLSLGPEELVDVRWHRASVAAAAREQQRVGGVPLYTITLTVRAQDGTTRPLQFTAGAEELHELVATLKGAVQQVEREVAA